MKITESQLRRIVRRQIRESLLGGAAVAYVTLMLIQKIVGARFKSKIVERDPMIIDLLERVSQDPETAAMFKELNDKLYPAVERGASSMEKIEAMNQVNDKLRLVNRAVAANPRLKPMEKIMLVNYMKSVGDEIARFSSSF